MSISFPVLVRKVRSAEAADVSQEERARLQMLAGSAYEAAIGYQCHANALDEITIIEGAKPWR